MERSPFAELLSGEQYWRDHYHWLVEQGYQLRPRYHPKWIPSWEKDPSREETDGEDWIASYQNRITDAVQLEDDRHVVLKRVERSPGTQEHEILQYFAEEPRRSDPRNHCVPFLGVLDPLDDAEHIIFVYPILRAFDDPEFDTIGEGLDFIRQILEGHVFLHEHGVLHQDVRPENYMMDPSGLYTERFHCWAPKKKYDMSGYIFPKCHRTEAWPKYYIIDFGHSSKYPVEKMPISTYPRQAYDNSAPEFESFSECNPFPIDVHRVGSMIRKEFLTGNPKRAVKSARPGFRFLLPLVESMTQNDPKARPTMQEALTQFDEIVSKLTKWKLRSFVVPPPRTKRDIVLRPYASKSPILFLLRRLKYMFKGLPPMPQTAARTG